MNPSIQIENSPIVRAIISYVLKSINPEVFKKEQKQIINADLVPKFSESIMESKFQTAPDRQIQMINIPRPIEKSPTTQTLQEIANPKKAQLITKTHLPQRRFTQQSHLKAIPLGEYGKIDSLLKDPTITHIECSGQGKPIFVVRGSQKLPTKIILNKQDIAQFLNLTSQKSGIPLIEGVFRVSVDNFIVNAVISESIGSRFIIKKSPVYHPNLAFSQTQRF